MAYTPARTDQPPMPDVDATLKEERVPTHRIRPLYRTTQIIWYILGVIETLLILRLFLRLLAANPGAGFTQFVYGLSGVFVGPFLLVFPGARIVQGNVLEWSTLLAMLVYLLVAWLIVKAIVMSRPVTTKEAEQKLPEQEKM